MHSTRETVKSLDLTKADVPMATVEELNEIKRLARTLPREPVVVIIGAGVGVMSMAILEERDDVVIFSIDSEFPVRQPMYRPGERANLIEAGWWESGRVIQVWGESQIVGRHWPVKCDYLIIDGDHRYQAVKEDLWLWLPHVRRGGVVSLHDYAPESEKPRAGVKRAVDETGVGDRISLVHWLISFQV